MGLPLGSFTYDHSSEFLPQWCCWSLAAPGDGLAWWKEEVPMVVCQPVREQVRTPAGGSEQLEDIQEVVSVPAAGRGREHAAQQVVDQVESKI